jgi:integrase
VQVDPAGQLHHLRAIPGVRSGWTAAVQAGSGTVGEARRRAYTPEEAGRLLGRMPLSWWDHILVFLGTGLRFGELAGLRCRRVHLDQPVPVLQVVEVRYQAGGQFGSGFKGRPKSDAGIRELPLAPLLVESIRRQHPPDADPEVLVFTGPGRRQRCPRWLADDAVAVQPPPCLPARGRPRWP